MADALYEWAWAEGLERRLVFSQARAAPSKFVSCPRDEFGATARWAVIAPPGGCPRTA
jgi:hypothetical protein